MNKFEELAKMYSEAAAVCEELIREYSEFITRKEKAENAKKEVIIDIVNAVFSEVAGYDVNIALGINVSYINTEGALKLGKRTGYGIELEFHKLTKSGKVSERKDTALNFNYYEKDGKIGFDGEFCGTPEEVVDFLKNECDWLKIK